MFDSKYAPKIIMAIVAIFVMEIFGNLLKIVYNLFEFFHNHVLGYVLLVAAFYYLVNQVWKRYSGTRNTTRNETVE